ncbi:hypothetical protein FRB99_000039 [Tulasnella sp. 403]|nr:hypothetical protein FRB99_000039 [Tulasnella sp. 403]
MDVQSTPAIATSASTTQPMSGEASPLPSLVTTPSSNNSFSPQTPASPTTRNSIIHASDDSPTSYMKVSTSTTESPSQLGPSSPVSEDPARSTTSYTSFAEKLASHDQGHIDTITQEVAAADLTIAEDGSYMETTSAHAALELKRLYDRRLGVGKAGVRSPYAITVTHDAQGKPLYRLSSSRPAPPVASPPPTPSEGISKSRRLRLSVGALLAPKSSRSAGPHQTTQATASKQPVSSSQKKPPARLVRTARSTSELRSRTNVRPTTATRYKQSSVSSSGGAVDDLNIMDRLGTDGDAFGVLMGWYEPDTASVSSSRDSVDSPVTGDEEFGFKAERHRVANPFGPGVSFATPSKPLDLFTRPPPNSPPQLRYMQSFESGLTARADDSDRRPPEAKDDRQAKHALARTASTTHSAATPYSTEVFEVLQTYKGIPLANTLSAVSTEGTFRLSSTLSAVPKNDPRFVIWGDIRPDGEDETTTSQSDASSISSESRQKGRRRGSSSVTNISTIQSANSSSAVTGSGSAEPQGQKVIVAATIERWIAQLTSELNYVELLDFFLTYRVYIRAIDLCQLLICRFHWALEVSSDGKNSTQDEIVKKIVRVRTFIAFRYWLSTFFQVDFLRNRELCKLLTTWLNSLKADEGIVAQNKDVLDIVRKLKKIVRECKEKWFRDGSSSAASTTDSSETRLSDGNVPFGDRSSEPVENPDADVDLDLGDPPSPSALAASNSVTSTSLPTASFHAAGLYVDPTIPPSRPSDATISPAPPASAGPTSGGLSQLHDLQATILASAKPAMHLKATPVPGPILPMHQSAISRALVNTMGKLGRWKRVLNSRSAVTMAACNDPTAFDIDVNSDSDRELGTSQRLPLTPNGRGAAFQAGLDVYLRAPTQTTKQLTAPSLSVVTTSTPSGRQSEDGLLAGRRREAAITAPAAATSPLPDASTGPPQRRLLRTASAIPLNPRLAALLDEQERMLLPAPDATPASEPQSAPPIPSRAEDDDDSAGEDEKAPFAPPGLDPSGGLRPTLHRPASSLSMRRIADYKSSPLSAPASSVPRETLPGVEDAARPRPASAEVHDLSIPVQAPSAAEMDAHHAAVESIDSDSLASEMEDDDYRRRPEIVALDDFDLSNSDSDSEPPDGVPRLRRMQRRLPNRRDFEFVRRSVDSVSSLGIRSSDAHSSVASGSGLSNRSRNSEVVAPVYEGAILPWHLDLIEDSDDGEPQDAEAALARLEGQIDANTQKEKLKKVDRWMRMVAARMAVMGEGAEFNELREEEEAAEANTTADNSASASSAGGSAAGMDDVASRESSRPSSVSPDAEDVPSVSVSKESGEDESVEARVDSTITMQSPELRTPDHTSVADLLHQQREALGAITPTPPLYRGKGDKSLPPTPTRTTAMESADEHEEPASAITTTTESTTTPVFSESTHRTSLASKRRGQNTSSLIRKADILLTSINTKAHPNPTITLHRSFILLHRSESLAQHWAMIERELFLAIKFGEIVSSSWVRHEDKAETLEWAAYIKERAKIKVDAKAKGHEPDISDLMAIRARFNLMVAFTATDVVLSHPNERAVVFSKFIRIAWKSYLQNNFPIVVALITGLQTPAVSVAMKRLWNRVGMWEMRVFDDLKEFANPRGNFRFIREAIDTMMDKQPMKANDGTTPISASASTHSVKGKSVDGRASVSQSCIPFIGIYLSDLQRYRRLPDYIDPTSPSTPVVIDKASGSLSSPRYPEVFSTLAPLPASVPLEALINVQKQRLTAGVVKGIVAGQHLASKVSFDLDRKLYQKCVRIKALPPDKLLDVAKSYGGEG